MKCPRCGLINPDIAQRCDCGYDFEAKSVKQPFFRQELPNLLKTYLTIVIAQNILGGIVAARSGNPSKLLVVFIWSAVVYPLYFQLVKKKPWARTVLMVLTFPVGTALLLMPEAKLYVLQKP